MNKPVSITAARALALLLAVGCSDPGTSGSNSGAGANNGTQFGDAVLLPDGAKADAGSSDSKTVGTSDIDLDATADATGPTGTKCDTEGITSCFNAKVIKACVNGEWVYAETCPDGTECTNGKCGTPTNCTPGQSDGCDGANYVKLCSDTGKAWITKKCPGKQMCIAGACKDVVCTPEIGTCLDQQKVQVCKQDGSGFEEPVACKPGSFCFGGKCVSLCETNLKISNNVGCEYWAADLDSCHDTFSAALNKDKLTPDFIPHSLIISNPGQFDAEVTINIAASCGTALCEPVTTCGGKNTECKNPSGVYALKLSDFVVPAGKTKEFKMPVMNVDGSGIFRKAIQVKSTQPIVAFQFNPFDAEGAFSNDASLLLPMNTLGKTYYAVALSSRPNIDIGLKMPSQSGYVTVIAASAGDTTVTVTPTDKVLAAPKYGVPQDGTTPASLDKGKPYTFKLKQFDVLNLEHLAEFNFKGISDLTGTKIVADKPVAVFCGHEEAVIGNDGPSQNAPVDPNDPNAKDSCCAEHIEEQMIPLEAWGTEAMCAKTKSRGGEKDLWYVVAGEDNVQLTTTPKTDLDGKTLGKAGDRLILQSDLSFMLKATGKVQVVQFIVSRGQTASFTGDPTMMVIPPKQQYREEYLIQTADGYGTNWVSVIRPKGMVVELDGAALADATFAAFGDNTWELGYFEVKKGTHIFKSKDGGGFGLMAYGYGNATAYGYPGGMNLK